MMDTLSVRAKALQASKIREVAEIGMKRFADVTPLWFGEGVWPTDPEIVDAAVAALHAGRHKYMPNNGDVHLRDAIVGYSNSIYGASLTRERVSVTNSGLQALVLTADSLASAGDRIVAIGPNWPNIPGVFEGRGAQIETIAVQPRNGKWALDLDRLLEATTPDTKAVLINSPHNPTGWTMTEAEQRAVLDHCRKHGVWIVSDDVYGRLYRWGRAAPSFLSIAEPDDFLISVNSFSKAWSMTGWRLGWIVAPAAIEAKLGQLNEFNSSCAPGFVQDAGRTALEQSETVIGALTDRLRAGYEIAESRLRDCARVSFLEPDGAFYVFFRVEGLDDSFNAALKILEETRVGLAPGVAFGPEGEGYLRLCYARDASELEEAFDRLAPFLGG